MRSGRSGEAIVSFFEDEDGVEYLCVVHAVTKHYGVVRIAHDAEKCSLTEVRLNGKQCGKVGEDEEGEFTFIPAGLKLLRIDRKKVMRPVCGRGAFHIRQDISYANEESVFHIAHAIFHFYILYKQMK